MRKFLSLVVSLAVAYGAAAIGSYFTIAEITGWYAGLAKALLNPPTWVFGPAWTILYTLMAIAAWRVYEKGHRTKKTREALGLYALQLSVNVLWSLIFFGFHSLFGGVAGILTLLVLIVLTAERFYKIDRIAGWLFAPYIAWVSFATYLNVMATLLNQ